MMDTPLKNERLTVICRVQNRDSVVPEMGEHILAAIAAMFKVLKVALTLGCYVSDTLP